MKTGLILWPLPFKTKTCTNNTFVCSHICIRVTHHAWNKDVLTWLQRENKKGEKYFFTQLYLCVIWWIFIKMYWNVQAQQCVIWFTRHKLRSVLVALCCFHIIQSHTSTWQSLHWMTWYYMDCSSAVKILKTLTLYCIILCVLKHDLTQLQHF